MFERVVTVSPPGKKQREIDRETCLMTGNAGPTALRRSWPQEVTKAEEFIG